MNYSIPFDENYAIINGTDVDYIVAMTKKAKVLQKHTRKISQLGGKDKRWQTRVNDEGTVRKIMAQTEKELYDKLYEFYYAKEMMSLKDLYPEWLQYKYKISNRPNNVHRLSTDFTKYYLNEPLSEEILNKPLAKVNSYDIKLWAGQLVKKYRMTKKQFGNVMVPLRQCLDMMQDKNIIVINPARNIRFDPGIFAPQQEKPPAETQIFFEDELQRVVKYSIDKAKETSDEMYLAIPLFVYTGVRPGECLGLKFKDFDKENSTVNIRRSFAVVEELNSDGSWSSRRFEVQDYLKKNAKPRVVVIPDSCFEIVRMIGEILKSKNIEREYLFKPYSPNNIERKLYRVCDSLNIRRRSLNKLRKTYVSRLINTGFDYDFIRKQAGHTTIQTTLNNYTFQTTRNEALLERLNNVVPNCTR